MRPEGWMYALRVRWRGLFRREAVERELDEELRYHVERKTEENIARGMTTEEARRAARIALGGVEQVKEQVRAVRAGAWLGTVMQDARFGLRMLRKNPGFTAVAVLTLALGIGANTAIFSIVDAVVLHPLPYKDSSRIVAVTSRTSMFPGIRLGVSWPAFQQIRSDVTAFEETSLYESTRMNLTQQGAPAMLNVVDVSDGYFEELGAGPQMGRMLQPRDQQPGENQIAVIADTLWRTRFGADSGVLGRTLILDDKPYLIVGVAPRGFAFPEDADVWVPLALSAEEQRNFIAFKYALLGKLRPAEKLGRAQVQLHAIAGRIKSEAPRLRDGYEIAAESLLETRVRNVRKAYLLLLGAATLVLLIACANLASFLLARGWGRQREMALRAALGASRGRIVRQVLIESMLLALLGGTAGIVLASGGVNLFRAIAPAGTPRLNEIAVNSSLLWFALATSIVAGLLFGFVPARRASSVDPNGAIKDGAAGGGGSARQPRLGSAFVIAEVALAFVLLVGAALTMESFSRLLRVNTGMRTDHLLTFNLPGPAFRPGMMTAGQMDSEADAGIERLREFLGQIQAVPGVEGVAASDHALLDGTFWMQGDLKIEGAVPPPSAAERVAYSRSVSPSFFQLMGIPLLRGREFAGRDLRGAQRVAIVNETMARQYWGTLDVLGKHLSVEQDGKGQPEWAEIVGVVADSRDVLLSNSPHSEYYLPVYQLWGESHQIMVRTALDPNVLANDISKQVWKVDAEQPITDVQTVSNIIAGTVGEPRLHAILLGVFAGVGLVLALLGVYGVLAFSVERRTREIGIRMALGARKSDILRAVVGHGLALALAGILLGTGAALGLSHVIASELFGVKPTNPLTFAGAAALMATAACLACYIPARRAMRVDPMVALRHE